ncbi:MAG: hypothetical protein IT539_06155 [Bradyrhizobiaceae bacterium]|nr:hypothetical protein [Bradyrhizobiaceae bacterium]
MPDWVKKRALITVRTYPVPSAKSIEASCTAGVTDAGEWIRLFPVPYRLMDEERRFSKWQWIELSLLKASDGRPESYKINPDSITVGESVGTKDGWRARREILEPLRRPSLCQIQRERDEHGSPTLGIFRPHEIKRLLIQPAEEAGWTPAQESILKQDTLFQKAPEHTLEKIPFDFRYEFRCGDADCKWHTMLCTDWEMGEAYRRWRREYGDQWEAAFRNRFEKEMIEKYDTHFFVGTVHQFPNAWIIVGLFYPPKREPDLFG